MKERIIGCTVAAVLCALSTSAYARGFRVDQVPSSSAPAACNTCHTMGGGSPRNVFGQAVAGELTPPLETADVNWAAICELDSDGDTYSNGAELGDPDCDWQVGDPPRTAAGDPSDPDVFPGVVDAGVPDTGGGVDAGPAPDVGGGGNDAGTGSADAGQDPAPYGDDDDGGCSATGPSGVWSPFLLLMFWMVALRTRGGPSKPRLRGRA